ncbi:MAG: RDD family protein [Chloroflexi bacterium]|nr:RDD family protein [Chloroflexota bacterium]
MPDIARLDRAAALLRELESLKTDRPGAPSTWERALARVYDAGLAVALEFALAGIGFVAAAWIWGDWDVEAFKDPGPAEVAFTAAIAVIWLGILGWNEIAGFGAGRPTFGKRLLGLRVVMAEDDSVPTRRRMLGRWATAFVPTGLVLAAGGLVATAIPLSLQLPSLLAFLAVPAAVFLGRDGRGLHDRIWRTRLIRPR